MAQNKKYRSTERDRNSMKNSHTYGQLIHYKSGKNLQCRKDSLFNKWCCKNCIRTFSDTIQKNKLKMDQVLNLRPDKTLRRKHRQNTL